MQVTKLEHATLRVTEGDDILIIDPGSFTAPLTDLDGVVAVVITHEHADHVTDEHLARIAQAAPSAPICAPEGVARALDDRSIRIVSPGDTVTAGSFALRFFGGTHEIIHTSLPIVDNVGVLVNDRLYYPGDSYALPDGADIELLAAPTAAPWLRLGDTMDFILDAKPRHSFGTHDAPLVPGALAMHRARMRWAAEQNGGTFHDLDPGDTLEL
ncbi:MBL fold metallo-hydrolase [Microbacterium sp.]|uniref:MBL fold metallo-hydrolase n=1 Tax=Microbacterium sp. TaxID=51671 RepID=UPI003F97D377